MFNFYDSLLNSALADVNSIVKTTATDGSSSDLNNFTETGVYQFSQAPTNIPAGSNGWLVVLGGAYSGTCKQIWLRWGTNNTNDYNTFVRTMNSNSWSDWHQIA